MKSALLINKFIPPDPSPTAKLLGDLGELLREEGWEVRYLGLEGGYRSQTSHLVVRLFRELGFHLGLLCRGLFSRPRPDLMIAFSSPPGLMIPVALIARLRGTRLIHWCMDLYPDVATALGVLKPGGLPERILGRLLSRSYQRCERVIALDEDMARRLRDHGVSSINILPPWPPVFEVPRVPEPSPSPLPKDSDTAPPEWLYSGNLGRAHEWQTLLEAQRLLEERGSPLHLVFQGGGNERAAARSEAKRLGLQHCEWREFAEPDQLVRQLHEAQALVVTQRTETEGMLYPSKLSTFFLTDTPLVWIGSTIGAIADQLRDRPRTCVAAPGDAETIADFLDGIPSPPSPGWKDDRTAAFANRIQSRRQEGLDIWRGWL